MENTKSIYDNNHSNWARTNNFSSSLRSYADKMISIEQPTATPSNQLFDNSIGCQQNIKSSNSNTMERMVVHAHGFTIWKFT